MALDEFGRITRIAQILGAPRDRSLVPIGIGDDAAVLDPSRIPPGEKLVWTIDVVVEGVHFQRDWLSFEDLGYRATVAAASDVLAMGARPLAAIVGWTLPNDLGDDAVEAIAHGQREAATEEAMSIIGGNLAFGGLSLTTTVIGSTARPLGRGGAKAGDRLVVVGALGEAALGRACFAHGGSDPIGERARRAFRRPRVLSREALLLGATAHAMIDVSDGLAQDVGHLAAASGVRAVIETPRLAARRAEGFEALATRLGQDVGMLELAGGDDYALVAAMPAGQTLPPGVDDIGFVESGQGVVVRDDAGVDRPAPPGYRHR